MKILGDSLEELGKLEENSIDAMLTDIPYNLGFMNKSWDSVGGPLEYQVWNADWSKKALKCLKPGAHGLIFCGRSTFHRAICGFEDAGFEIRDVLLWMYMSGMPKVYDIYKALKKEDPELAKIWKDYKNVLKPAFEPIVLVRKPLDGTYTENMKKWGTGGLNIGECRIDINIENEEDSRFHNLDKNIKRQNPKKASPVTFHQSNGKVKKYTQKMFNLKGRYPTNIIIDEMIYELFNMISGIKKPGKTKPVKVGNWCNPIKTVYGGQSFKRSFEHFNLRDGGGMGKFFYVPKASTREKETGLENIEKQVRDKSRKGDPANAYNRNHKVANYHPTVKPIQLLAYLVRLIKPPTEKPTILDPFAGSGSTGIACKIEHCNYILVEKNPDYFKILEKRLDVDIREFEDFTDSVVIEDDESCLKLIDFF